MKLCYFNDYRLGVIKGDNVVDVTEVGKDIPQRDTRDIIVGLIGAFIGDRLIPRLNIHLGTGIVSLIFNAAIGAIVLLLIVRLLRGGGGWGWRRRW